MAKIKTLLACLLLTASAKANIIDDVFSNLKSFDEQHSSSRLELHTQKLKANYTLYKNKDWKVTLYAQPDSRQEGNIGIKFRYKF